MPSSEEDVKAELKSAETEVGATIHTDYGDGWHYQRNKSGNWLAKKESGTNWYDLTTNDKFKPSIDKLDAKYPKVA